MKMDGLLKSNLSDEALRPQAPGPRPEALRPAVGPTLALPRGLSMIGAAEDCAVRIRGAGVQPWHCVVTLGARRTIVRALAPDARLNGRPFEEVELAVGDRLQLGDLELEALADRSASFPGNEHVPDDDQGHVDRVRHDDPMRRLDELVGRLQVIESQQALAAERGWVGAAMLAQADGLRRDLARRGRALRRQGRQLSEATAILRREWSQRMRRNDAAIVPSAAPDGGWQTPLDELRQAVAELSREQSSASDARADLESRVAQIGPLGQELALLRQAIDEHGHRLAALVERDAQAPPVEEPRLDCLAGRCEQLERELTELQSRHADWQAERDALRGEHRRSQEQLAMRSDQIDRKLESLAVQQQAMHERREAHARDDDARSHGHRTQIEQRLTELRVERENLEQDRRRAHAERALERHIEARPTHPGPAAAISADDEAIEERRELQPVDTASEAVAAEPPESNPDDGVAEPVAGHVAEPTMPNEAEIASVESAVLPREMPPTDPPPEPKIPDNIRREPAPESEAKEESIEEYMARLMSRVRGISQSASGEPAAPVRSKPRGEAVPMSTAAITIESPVARGAAEAPEQAEAPFEMRRRPAPEQTADLSAMRELANMNARQALAVHSRRRIGSKMNGKLIVAVSACLAVGILVGMGGWRSLIFQASLGVSLLAALAWGIQYMALRRKLRAATARLKDVSPGSPEDVSAP